MYLEEERVIIKIPFSYFSLSLTLFHPFFFIFHNNKLCLFPLFSSTSCASSIAGGKTQFIEDKLLAIKHQAYNFIRLFSLLLFSLRKGGDGALRSILFAYSCTVPLPLFNELKTNKLETQLSWRSKLSVEYPGTLTSFFIFFALLHHNKLL